MSTLDSFFPEGATRGDGRKFRNPCWGPNEWFEPIFKTKTGNWVGLNYDGGYEVGILHYDWQEYKEPPKTKKVKLYQPVYRGYGGTFCTSSQYFYEWHSDKDNFPADNIVGWIEIEAEIIE